MDGDVGFDLVVYEVVDDGVDCFSKLLAKLPDLMLLIMSGVLASQLDIPFEGEGEVLVQKMEG